MPKIKVTEPGTTPQPYKVRLDHDDIKLGRSSDNHIVLVNPSTSSSHCLIKRVDGGYIAEDLNSTNGMKLDEARFKFIDICENTAFKLGDIEVDFTFTEDELKILSSEGDFESKQQPSLPSVNDSQAVSNTTPQPKRRDKSIEEEFAIEDTANLEQVAQAKEKARNRQEKRSKRKQFTHATHQEEGNTITNKAVIMLIVLSFVGFAAGLGLRYFLSS